MRAQGAREGEARPAIAYRHGRLMRGPRRSSHSAICRPTPSRPSSGNLLNGFVGGSAARARAVQLALVSKHGAAAPSPLIGCWSDRRARIESKGYLERANRQC